MLSWYCMCVVAEAAQCLVDMPPRSEEELDPVTLHNIALTSMGKDPTLGFQKLQFLLQQPSFPAETFCNLLLLYIKFEVGLLYATSALCHFFSHSILTASNELNGLVLNFVRSIRLFQFVDVFNRLCLFAFI